MSEKVSIKTEPFANDYKQENFNNTTKPEHFTNMGNDIMEDELDLDNMEEFLPEKVNEYTTDIIKKEDEYESLPENSPSTEYVDEMDEFLPENSNKSIIDIIKKEDVDDSPGFYTPSSLTWKSDDRTEALSHDEVHHQQQHLTNKITQDISLPKLELIDVHTDEDDSDGLEINDDTDSNVSDNIDSSIISSSEHKCELCGTSFTEHSCLLRHMRNKHPSSINSEHICKICNKKFDTQAGLHRHSYRIHPVARKHKCEICGRSYRQPQNLRAHMRNKHPSSIDSEYTCEICYQRFTTQTGRDRHSYKKHRVATKHKCEICGTCYRGSNNLQVHMRKRHPSYIASEYICEICSQRFTTQKGLDRHFSHTHPAHISTKHECEICGSCYSEYRSLRAHIINKHPSSVDLEYICEICHQRFTTQNGLTRHSKRIHKVAQTPTKHKCEIQSNADYTGIDKSVTSIIRERKA
ncbi:uncharacterized protein [Musca autumnalis]|uniref:uncharacterized protein n=1 Tax=Musca autumnalis TaxID=221902 RepID=UPI003CF52F0F